MTEQTTISELLAAAARPAILSSFGKESMLLLALARASEQPFDVVWFRDALERDARRFAERIITDWDLTVYSWAARDRYALRHEDGLSLVSEYAMGAEAFPLLLDIEEGEQCALALADMERTPHFHLPWDVVLWGWRDEDAHAALPGYRPPPDGFLYGGARWYAPLRAMSEREVWQAITERGVPYDTARYAAGGVDADTLALCTRCFSEEGEVFCPAAQKQIPAHRWTGTQSLAAFRARFDLEGAHKDG